MKQHTYLIALFLILITYGVIHELHFGADVVVKKKNLDNLPVTISGRQGIDIPMDEKIIRILATDVCVFRNYVSPKSAPITVYIGYYGTKKGGRSDHIPEGCYPGAGWSILWEGQAQVIVPDAKSGKEIVLNTLEVKKNDEKQLVYHWYQSDRAHVMVSGVQQNVHRFKRRLLSNRDDGAFVRVSMDIQGDQAKAKAEIEKFIKQLFPLIAEHWPLEEEVQD